MDVTPSPLLPLPPDSNGFKDRANLHSAQTPQRVDLTVPRPTDPTNTAETGVGKGQDDEQFQGKKRKLDQTETSDQYNEARVRALFFRKFLNFAD